MGSFTATIRTDDDDDTSNDINHGDDVEDSLFAPLSVCQTVRRAACIFQDNMALFLTMTAIVVVPIFLIFVVALFTISWEAGSVENVSSFIVAHARPLLLVLLLVMAVYTFVGIAMQAAMIRVVVEVYATPGRYSPLELQREFMTFIRHGMQYKIVWSIFCYNFLVHVGIMSITICFEIVLSIALFIIGYILLNLNNDGWTVLSWIGQLIRIVLVSMTSIYVKVSMFATIPAIVVEHGLGGWYRAMHRSWDLVTTRRVFVFATHALYGIAVWLQCMIFLLVVYRILATTNMQDPTWLVFWILLVSAFVSMVLMPFHAM
jgi:hypothetical protein